MSERRIRIKYHWRKKRHSGSKNRAKARKIGFRPVVFSPRRLVFCPKRFRLLCSWTSKSTSSNLFQ